MASDGAETSKPKKLQIQNSAREWVNCVSKCVFGIEVLLSMARNLFARFVFYVNLLSCWVLFFSADVSFHPPPPPIMN